MIGPANSMVSTTSIDTTGADLLFIRGMSERDWLTSSDSAAMWYVVEGTATERQCKHFVLACLGTLALNYEQSPHNWNRLASEWAVFYRAHSLASPANLLREIFGNPWRRYGFTRDPRNYLTGTISHLKYQPPQVYLDPAWLRWQDGAIPKMAQAVYGSYVTKQEESYGPATRYEFNPAAMPMLADMLEEAGCSDDTILMHLRRKEGHVRGCWALELFLNP